MIAMQMRYEYMVYAGKITSIATKLQLCALSAINKHLMLLICEKLSTHAMP